MISFIFTSLADRPFAALSRQHLLTLGVDAWSVVDSNDGITAPADGELLTTFPRRGAMYGKPAAVGMIETMLDSFSSNLPISAFSPHLRMDADTLLFPAAVEWLAGATVKARGYVLDCEGVRGWCGCWSAPVAALRRIAEVLANFDMPPERCGSCLIFRLLRRTCGIDLAPSGSALTWQSGQAIPPGAHLVTLRRGLAPEVRAAELVELFGT